MSQQLPDEIRYVDRLADLWAQTTRDSNGGIKNSPIARAIAEAEGAALPGGEEYICDDVLMFDSLLARAGVRTRLLVNVWYRSNAAAEVKASRLGISRAALYTEWRATLWYLHGRIESRREQRLQIA